MSGTPDGVERYLDELAARLPGPGAHVRRVLAECEAHLRDAVAAGRAAGLSDADAERAAVEKFGTPSQIATQVISAQWAHARRPVLRAGMGLLVRMAAAAMVVAGGAAVLAVLAATISSRTAVFGLPARVSMPARLCTYWLTIHPDAGTCRQAGTLEAAGDIPLSLETLGGLGAGILATAVLVRRRRPRPVEVLPPVLGPALGVAAFGAATVGLAALAAGDAVLLGAWGRGLWLCGAASTLLAALVSAMLLLRALPASLSRGSVR